MTLYTKRLILRRWEESDAEEMFKYASDPDVGPITGWPVHKDIEESRFVISSVLQGKEAYAICLKEDNKAIGSIELKLGDKAEVIPRSVKTGITELEYNNESFDIVFMDPPYGNRLEKNVLEQLKKSVIISNDTIVIVEASIDTNFDYLDSLGYSIYKEKRYKTNKHLFLKRDRV